MRVCIEEVNPHNEIFELKQALFKPRPNIEMGMNLLLEAGILYYISCNRGLG